MIDVRFYFNFKFLCYFIQGFRIKYVDFISKNLIIFNPVPLFIIVTVSVKSQGLIIKINILN